MSTEKSPHTKIVEANLVFGQKFYEILSKSHGNMVFSPISAHTVLSMASQGAQGSTSQKLSSALGIPDAKNTAQGYKEILERLNAAENITLHLANKIFLHHEAKMLEGFKSSCTKNFFSEVQLVEFIKSQEAADIINRWVEDKTNQKIKNLISPDALDELTRLVLVNAIYFKGNWKNQFDRMDTKQEDFFLTETDTCKVDMMHLKKTKLRYAEDLDSQIVELPYENTKYSMVIILPREKNGIEQLEAKLATTNLAEVFNKMYNTDVIVSLPKFKIEQEINLEKILIELGLGEIFDREKANFKGMIELAPGDNLYVSKVIQKAFIEVNEEGAEAAAATAMIMMRTMMMPRPPKQFSANHPFIFAIWENTEKGNPLFLGRISEFKS